MKNLILSLSSALMLSLGWLGLTGLPMLAALVPLMFISAGQDGSRRGWWKTAGWAALALGAWSGATTWWIWYAAPIGAILSVVITVVLFGGAFMIYHSVSKRAPLALAFTILISGWIAAEYLYMVSEFSFPWLALGNGFANDTFFVQWYGATGVYGGSLWALLCNVLLFSFLMRRGTGRLVSFSAALLAPAAASAIMYFTYDGSGEPVKVSVIQPNIDPYHEKFYVPQQAQDETIFSLARQAPADADLIVLPETAIDGVLENDLESDRALAPYRDFMRANFPSARMIAGASGVRYYYPGDRISTTARPNRIGGYYDHYNSAILIDSSSRSAVHHKSKLTPGVEQMPYYSLTRHLEWLIVDLGGISGQLGYDSVRTVFGACTGEKVAAAICYESVYGAYFAEFVRDGAGLMTVITNDGWWHDTPGYRQHFSFARLRAIETRRDIARSANTGISGFIDGRGDVIEKSGWWVPAQLSATLHSRSVQTFYVRYGDYIARVCCLVFGLCVLYYIAYRVRKHDHIVAPATPNGRHRKSGF